MATVPRCFRQLTTSALLYRTLRSKSAIQFGIDVQQTCGNIHGISALNTKRFSASTNASKNWKPSLENDDDNDDFRFSKGMPAKKYPSKFSSAQKGSTSVTRPSRYQFNEFVDGDDDVNGFWMKRSRGSLTTRQKLEWYTKQIHRLISENKVHKTCKFLLC